MRPPRRRSRSRIRVAGGGFHLLLALCLLGTLLAPVLPLAEAAAAAPSSQGQRGGPPPAPAPVRVAAVGSFQTALGCPADYDASCPLTQLSPTGGGGWAAVLPVPPGDYALRIVASSDTDRSLGRGGDPDGGDIAVSVPGDAAGLYVGYDAGTGEIVAEPVAQRVTLVTEVGDQLPMAPAGGGYELFFDAQPGSYGFQILVDDQPVAQDAINLDAPSRVFVGVDESGAITGLDTVDDTTVAVTKQDEGGAPLPGACYALLDRGGTPAAQACDGDDGAADGTTTVRAPNGVDPGAYDLIETLTPDGQTAADAQALDLGPGGFAVEAVVAGEDQGAADDSTEPAETPEEDGGEDQGQTAEQAAGQVVLRSVDENGDSLPGSCFVLIELGFELCDGDGDGAVVFDGVPAGSYTVAQSAAPAGFEANPDTTIEVGPDGARLRVPHAASGATEESGDGIAPVVPVEPVEGGTADDGTEEDGGSLALAVRDRDGNPVPGGCFALSPRDGGGGDGTNACDGDDGADDGEVRFAAVPGGRYRLDPTLVPPGFRPPDPQGIELGDGDAASLTVTLRGEAAVDGEATAEPTVEPTEEATAAAQPAGPGRLVILVADDDGQPVGNTCFAIAGEGANFPEICDQGNDGRLNIPDLPAGEYRVRQLQTERGLVVNDEERTVEVRSGEDTELPVVNQPEASAAEEPTESATEEPEDGPTEEPGDGPAPAPTADGTGELRIEATDQDGNPAPFGCYLLVGPAQAEPVEVCDGDADDADPDDGVVLRQSLPPGEYQIFETRVPPGAEPAVDPPLVAVEDGETATARFGAGAESDEGSRQEQEQEQPPVAEDVVGAMLVTIAAEDGQPLGGACVALVGEAAVGPVCDGEDGDEEPDEGRVRLADLEAGDYTVALQAPDGFADVEEQPATVAPDETVRVGFELAAEQPATGSLRVVARDEADDAAAGACYAVTGPTTAEACDDEAGDAADEPGVVLFEGLEPGDYAVAETRPATGFDAAPDASNADVRAGQTAEVEFSPTRQPETGGLAVAIAAAGQPVPGACLTLAGPTTIGPVCDVVSQGWMAAAAQEAPQDADPSPGRIELTEIPVGTYDLTLSNLPADLAVPAPAEVEVRGGAVSDLAIDLEPAPGTLVILVEDEAGDPVGGTCVTLDGPVLLEDICDQGNDGRLNFPELPGGDYAITQTASDDAVEPAAPTTATVPAGGTAEVTLRNPRRQEATPEPTAATATATATAEPEETATTEPEQTATAEPEETATPDAETDEPDPSPEPEAVGTLVLANQGPDGTPIGGGCFRLLDGEGTLVAEACDDGPNDGDPDPGEVAFVGFRAGAYTAEQVSPPAGFSAAEPRPVEVAADSETVELFVVEAEAPATGTVVLQAEDEAGAVVEGQCFQIASDGNQFGPFCDNGGDDGNPAPGTLTIAGLPVGIYEAMPLFEDGGELPVAEDDGQLAAAQQVVEQRSFTVRASDQPLVVRLRIAARRQADGDLLVSKRDERNRPLAGSCFALLDGDGDAAAEACDDERGDGDGTSGQIRFDGVDAGDYTLSETRAPDGFVAAEDTDIQIVGGRLRRVTVRNEPLPEATASLAVRTVTEGGDPLPGACYALIAGGGQVGPVCDDADGDDGQTTFNDLEAGSYILRETREASPDYAAAADRALLIRSGEATTVDVVNAARPGSVLIAKTDEAGDPLAGACFSLLRGDGSEAYALCDGDASDGAPDDGALLLGGVAAGDYLARETRPPAAYRAGADQELTVAPNRRTDLRFENRPLPPPPERGDLIVSKTDDAGRSLPGACFALLRDGATVAGPRCDGGDGADDGTVRFVGVGVGDYALRETRRPSADYQPTADLDVSVQLNLITEIVVENQLRLGRVVVRKTDVDGDPLANACFNLEGDGRDPACTDAAGSLEFPDLTPGAYRLVETQAPSGYLAAAPVEGVAVRPGATTTITVVNELAPPPPDTGSLQILKFYCPAGDGGEGTEIVDSSDAGPSRLARTAGCERGDARFSVLAASGEGGPGEVSTGDDGRYQTTLQAGDYDLTELAPDLPGEASETVSVFVNQMTTVVVLNYVAPPAPAPAVIDLLKWTCEPGFQGTVFADFVNGCVADANLTNSVVFRLGGELTARRLTGDGGQQGVTGFAQLPPGAYTLREEPPTQAQTVFAFCGADPNAPDRRSVGPIIDLDLGAGERIVCSWFNVPDDLTAATGTIVVHKYACALNSAQAAPAGFDWYRECGPQGAGVRFSLALLDGDQTTDLGSAATTDDGLVRFNQLDPGVYKLEEIGATWCRAESDSVDARGNVVVRAGQRANVWIFNCLGTKNPPNTGAGPLAAAPPLGPSALAAALGLLWPVVGIGGWSVRRRRAA